MHTVLYFTSSSELSFVVWLQSTGVSFDVTPPKKGQQSFTPSKLMLMNRERRMNMLSPEGGKSLYHTDIETGK